VISDPTGADILIDGEPHKYCLLTGVYSYRATAKLGGLAFIRANWSHRVGDNRQDWPAGRNGTVRRLH
jgi:hypothetical protein